MRRKTAPIHTHTYCTRCPFSPYTQQTVKYVYIKHIYTYCTNKASCCFLHSPHRLTTERRVAEKNERQLWDKPLFSANEQVRKTAPVPDYTVSRRATNPALAIHPVPCADLLTNGQMPVTHFPVAFPPVSFAAPGVATFAEPKKKGSQHYS